MALHGATIPGALALVAALLALATGDKAQPFVSPFTGGQAVDLSISGPTAEDFLYTCDPTTTGQPGGQPAIEIVNALNCTVRTQQLSQWQTSPVPPGPTSPVQFLLSLNASNTDLTTGCPFRFTSPPLPFAPNWVPNPTGATRTTTMSSLCFYSSPGCLTRRQDVLEVASSCAQNNRLWLALANGCAGKSGTCISTLTGAEAPGCTVATPGLLRINPLSICANFFWGTVPGAGTADGSVATLEDPLGNLYIQHAFQGATYPGLPPPTVPGTQVPLYPPGWITGSKNFAEGAFAVTRLRPNNMCAVGPTSGSLGTAGTAGCMAMVVVDALGNGYHRYYWSGYEPVQFPDAQPPLPARLPVCQDECSFEAWAAPAFSGSVAPLTPTTFTVTVTGLPPAVPTYIRPTPGATPDPDVVGKGFGPGPAKPSDMLAALLATASPTNPLAGALVAAAHSSGDGNGGYSSPPSVSTPGPGGGSDWYEVYDDTPPPGGQYGQYGRRTLLSGDDTQIMYVTITGSTYNSEARSLQVTVVTSGAPPPLLLRRMIDYEVGDSLEELQLEDGAQLSLPVLWVLDP